MVERAIDGDPVNPRVETGFAFETFDAFVRLDKCILHKVVGVLVVARHVIDGGVKSFFVTLNQMVVCRTIAILNSRDESFVVGFRQINPVLRLPGFRQRAGLKF